VVFSPWSTFCYTATAVFLFSFVDYRRLNMVSLLNRLATTRVYAADIPQSAMSSDQNALRSHLHGTLLQSSCFAIRGNTPPPNLSSTSSQVLLDSRFRLQTTYHGRNCATHLEKPWYGRGLDILFCVAHASLAGKYRNICRLLNSSTGPMYRRRYED
jgi:hypothetical protein